MNNLMFLEKMAEYTHYNIKTTKLINDQPMIVIDIYKKNDGNLMRKYLGQGQDQADYVANPSDVAQV